MKIYEIGTGYTPIPAQMGAATEIVVEELTKAFLAQNVPAQIIDIAAQDRAQTDLPILEVPVPGCFHKTDVQLGLVHKLKRVVYSISLARTLRNLLKHSQEQVILHFHNQYNLFFFLKLVSPKLRKRAQIAYTNHSGIWRLSWEKIQGTIRKRYFQETDCMRKADVIFVLNEETKENAIKHLGVEAERITVIANGVNVNTYCPLSEDEKRQAQEKWNLTGKTVILQVGSIYENKGQLRSIQILLPLLQQNKDLVFAYAGGVVDEAYQQEIEKFARENELQSQICYMGVLKPGEELNSLFNTAKASIMSSQYEGFSLVSIESCAAGVPVLVDDAGIVRVGEGSVIVNTENITEVYNDLQNERTYRTLCEAARCNAAENYSWEKIARVHIATWAE